MESDKNIIIPIKILSPHACVPSYATLHSAGMDLTAAIAEKITLLPMQRALIPLGFAIALPEGFEAQVRPRSGLAMKHGISVLNSPGTIDADYRGEMKVLLVNFSDQPFIIEPGLRVAQMVVTRYSKVSLEIVDSLSTTERGEGGYGSTGLYNKSLEGN